MTTPPAPPARPAEPPAGASAQSRDTTQLEIAMLGALPPWRGVAPYTRDLVTALEEVEGLGVEFFDFAALYPARLYPGGAPVDPDGTPPRFARTQVRRYLTWYNPTSWGRAGLAMRGRVVHGQCWSYVLSPIYAAALSLARARGSRIILTLHNVRPHERSAWKRRLYQSVFRLADHFIVHSHRNAQELIEAHPRALGRLTVIPLGLHSVPRTRGLSQEEARRELGLPLDRPVVLAFGNIRPYKGLDVLLPAFRRALDAGTEATLVIAGQPWCDFEPYRRLIEELGLSSHVRAWLEFVPEQRMEAFFAAADLAVYPYTSFDAQSAAATLALSSGLPIVVSDIGGLPELVDDSRAVVPPDDPEALAGALRAVLSDAGLRAELAGASRRRAAELDWRSVAQHTAEVYRELASP